MFSKIGHAAIKTDLSNTKAICEALGNPETKFKTIHIAGTNGKGSVSHMLAAIFQNAGYKTGLYTSPHLNDFRERIKINGLMIPEEKIIEFTERMSSIIESIEPSFFEVTVGMAFEYFAQEHVDIAIIETGLGGRLDSTNVIMPALSIITNIGYDHQQLLGDTLEKISQEKAGIIKHQVPVVIGRSNPETKPVFLQKADLEQAPICFAEQEWSVEITESNPDSLSVRVIKKTGQRELKIDSDLAGRYQCENIGTVIAAIDILHERGWQIGEINLLNGIKHAKKITGLGGRWEMIQREPMLILDVAHNEDGIQHVINQINAMNYDKLFIILGMSKDKDIKKVIARLPTNAQYCYTKANIPRALDTATLEEIAKEAGLKGRCFEHVNLAIESCIAEAGKHDLIVVCGSIFVVGEVDKNKLINR